MVVRGVLLERPLGHNSTDSAKIGGRGDLILVQQAGTSFFVKNMSRTTWKFSKLHEDEEVDRFFPAHIVSIISEKRIYEWVY